MPLMPPAMLCSLPPSWANTACSHQKFCNTAGQEPWAEGGPELPTGSPLEASCFQPGPPPLPSFVPAGLYLPYHPFALPCPHPTA